MFEFITASGLMVRQAEGIANRVLATPGRRFLQLSLEGCFEQQICLTAAFPPFPRLIILIKYRGNQQVQTAVCGTIWREYAESNKEVFLVEECAERSYVHGSKRRVTIDIQGAIPVFIDITDGKVHDVNVLDILIPEAGSYIVMDRGYLDFERLCRLHQALSFFVIRAKRNLQFQRRYSHAGEKSTGVRSDQTVLLTGLKTSMIYPDPIRRISYYSVEIDKRLVFLTNDFNAPACTIAALYRYRWQVDFCSPAASVTSAAYPPRLVRTTGGTRSGQEAFAWGPISCS